MKVDLPELALSVGFTNAEYIDGACVECDPAFRDMCVVNSCGKYGKCYMCPDDIGDVHTLIEKVKKYPRALIYQSIHTLEDSFDFEGMQAGGKLHQKMSYALEDKLREAGLTNYLHLGKGGCGLCKTCAKVDGLPCRHIGYALSSVEAYGINVSKTVKNTSMKYINGVNTVTYFGMVFVEE